MRIIAGLYRGRNLKNPPDLRTRPTSDRLRETLFNVLAPRIDEETRFLDLCAGTGAIGIEALSRGAEFAVFVDKSRKSCGLIEANLDLLGIPEDQTEVVMSDAEEHLRRLNKNGNEVKGFEIIYFDPPYKSDYRPVLEELSYADSKILSPEGILVVEHHHKNELLDSVWSLRRWRILKQGDTALSFYERN
ncbi:MAG: 16S rRNA (guanine(966)-N(2))-methyltransferase RsmD [Acidobacteriota bacterium]|nr:16S rRNA (guanine(966)-N(2))-methyltransferase RsmD [Acidobacteriota bacterium]